MLSSPRLCFDKGDKGYVLDSVNAVKESLSCRKILPFNSFVNFHTTKLTNNVVYIF